MNNAPTKNNYLAQNFTSDEVENPIVDKSIEKIIKLVLMID